MSSTPQIQAQSLATESIGQLMEFDFRSIGGTQRVFVSNTQENEGTYANLDITWDGSERTFQHIDFSMSNLRSDLTGQVAEPTLKIAAHDLFAISDWASATTNFTMMDYRGLKIKRMRLFFNTPTLIDPQTYFVKSVDELSAEQMVFTLTASLGTENGNKPSARKLEI